MTLSNDPVQAAAALLARGATYLDLQIAHGMLTRSGIRQAALWARQAAIDLERAAGNVLDD